MSEYQQLFDAYVADMRNAAALARQWWAQLEAGAHGRDPRERWPFGAASHPFILHVYRHYGLECQRLNDEAEEAEEAADTDFDPHDESAWGRDEEEEDTDDDLATLTGPIEPRQLLVDMLAGRADDLQAFLQDMVFDPLGLDADDRWV